MSNTNKKMKKYNNTNTKGTITKKSNNNNLMKNDNPVDYHKGNSNIDDKKMLYKRKIASDVKAGLKPVNVATMNTLTDFLTRAEASSLGVLNDKKKFIEYLESKRNGALSRINDSYINALEILDKMDQLKKSNTINEDELNDLDFVYKTQIANINVDAIIIKHSTDLLNKLKNSNDD